MAKANGPTTLFLVRHGLTDWNAEGRIQGNSDIPLNRDGRSQARRLARRLRAVPLDAVYTSDLDRAVETAHIVKGERPIALRSTENLREFCYGAWEGKTRVQLEAAGLGPTLRRWNEGRAVLPPRGGETREDVDERIDHFLAAVIPRHAGETMLVVSHGGTLRLMLCRLLGMSPEKWGAVRQGNTALSKAVLVPGKPPRVELINDTSHLRGTRFDRTAGPLQRAPIARRF